MDDLLSRVPHGHCHQEASHIFHLLHGPHRAFGAERPGLPHLHEDRILVIFMELPLNQSVERTGYGRCGLSEDASAVPSHWLPVAFFVGQHNVSTNV